MDLTDKLNLKNPNKIMVLANVSIYYSIFYYPQFGLEFKIIDTKLYVPVVSLSKENDIRLLEQLKSGFKRTIK